VKLIFTVGNILDKLSEIKTLESRLTIFRDTFAASLIW